MALKRNESANSGLIVPGYARNSDLSASITFVYSRIIIYAQNSKELGHIFGDKFAIFNLIKFG